ncbi:hypothetical protein HDU97_008062 [Phlyctochytrium planicorne]|nr:hypothetical protein HDU97_008062 [Phlyctochytrium planicorne]
MASIALISAVTTQTLVDEGYNSYSEFYGERPSRGRSHYRSNASSIRSRSKSRTSSQSRRSQPKSKCHAKRSKSPHPSYLVGGRCPGDVESVKAWREDCARSSAKPGGKNRREKVVKIKEPSLPPLDLTITPTTSSTSSASCTSTCSSYYSAPDHVVAAEKKKDSFFSKIFKRSKA